MMEKDYTKIWKEYNKALSLKKEEKYPDILLPDWVTKTLEDKFEHNAYFLKYGDYFLFQIIYEKSDTKEVFMSYPKIGLFLEYAQCDQTIELKFVENIRAWEYRFKHTDESSYCQPTIEINGIIDWSVKIMIFEVWKSKPNWKEIRKAYKKTFYFGNPRVNKIKDIIK